MVDAAGVLALGIAGLALVIEHPVHTFLAPEQQVHHVGIGVHQLQELGCRLGLLAGDGHAETEFNQVAAGDDRSGQLLTEHIVLGAGDLVDRGGGAALAGDAEGQVAGDLGVPGLLGNGGVLIDQAGLIPLVGHLHRIGILLGGVVVHDGVGLGIHIDQAVLVAQVVEGEAVAPLLLAHKEGVVLHDGAVAVVGADAGQIGVVHHLLHDLRIGGPVVAGLRLLGQTQLLQHVSVHSQPEALVELAQVGHAHDLAVEGGGGQVVLQQLQGLGGVFLQISGHIDNLVLGHQSTQSAAAHRVEAHQVHLVPRRDAHADLGGNVGGGVEVQIHMDVDQLLGDLVHGGGQPLLGGGVGGSGAEQLDDNGLHLIGVHIALVIHLPVRGIGALVALAGVGSGGRGALFRVAAGGQRRQAQQQGEQQGKRSFNLHVSFLLLSFWYGWVGGSIIHPARGGTWHTVTP